MKKLILAILVQLGIFAHAGPIEDMVQCVTYMGTGSYLQPANWTANGVTGYEIWCPSTPNDFICGYCNIYHGTFVPNTGTGPGTRGNGGACGSKINVDDLAVGEAVKVWGTEERLSYITNRQWGRVGDYKVNLPLTSTPIDSNLTDVEVEIDIAGQSSGMAKTTATTNMNHSFTWDGKDNSANILPASAEADVAVKYYLTLTPIPLMILRSKIKLGRYKALQFGSLGGWTLSSVHFYDAVSGQIYFGNGDSMDVPVFKVDMDGSGQIEVDAGGGFDYYMAVLKGFNEAYLFDSNGKHIQTRSTRTGEVLKTMSYNGSGELTGITNGYGKTISITRPSGTSIVITSPYGQATTLSLDGSGRVETISDPEGNDFEITYNSTNGLIETFEKPGGAVNTFGYTADGYLYEDDHSGGSSWDISKTRYHSNADINTNISMVSAEGRTTDYSILMSGGLGYYRVKYEPNGSQSTYGYTPASVEYFVSPAGRTSLEYVSSDARFGNMAPYTSTRYSSMSYQSESATISVSDTFTASNLLVLTSDSETTSINSKVWTRAYSNSTKQDSYSTPEGRDTIVEYNGKNDVVGYQYASFAPVDLDRDADGRVFLITHSARVTTIDYDVNGFVESIKNAEGQTTAFTYNDNGQVESKTFPDSRVVNFTYDSNGNVASVQTPSSKNHGFVSNLFDLLYTYTAPVLGMTNYVATYTYNNDRQVTLITMPDSSTIDFDYGTSGYAKGLLETLTTAQGAYGRTYNGASQVTQITSPQSVTNNFTYEGDLFADSSTTTGSFTAKVGHTYSGFIKATTVVTDNSSSTSSISYTYDDDRLIEGAGDMTITRDADTGFITETALGNVTEHYSYNSTYGEISQYQVKYSGSEIYKETYTRDLLGRITTKVVVDGGTTTYDYEYDSSGRLYKVYVNSSLARTYNYDNNSNRSSLVAGSTTSGTYDDQDRISTYGANTYSHTTNGYLSQVTDGTNTISYTYDALGSLTQAVVTTGLGTDTYTYLNDALGRRIERKKNSTLEKRFIYDELGRLSAELDASGDLVSHFVYATMSHSPDYMISGGVKYKFVKDQLGSILSVVNSATGSVSSSLRYDEFGRITSSSTPEFQPFGFAGGVNDLPSKLVRFGARDYDAETGRWTSKDPILFGGGDPNLYGYVLQDPINLIDPEGKFATIGIGAGVGAIAGAATSSCPAGSPGWWQDVAAGFVGGALIGTGVGVVGGSVGLVGGVASTVGSSIGGSLAGAGGAAISVFGGSGGACGGPPPPTPPGGPGGGSGSAGGGGSSGGSSGGGSGGGSGSGGGC